MTLLLRTTSDFTNKSLGLNYTDTDNATWFHVPTMLEEAEDQSDGEPVTTTAARTAAKVEIHRQYSKPTSNHNYTTYPSHPLAATNYVPGSISS